MLELEVKVYNMKFIRMYAYSLFVNMLFSFIQMYAYSPFVNMLLALEIVV